MAGFAPKITAVNWGVYGKMGWKEMENRGEEMYTVALCDDRPADLDQIERYLDRYQNCKHLFELRPERFSSGEELLERVRREGYRPDIVLLDIYLSGMSGMEAAEELRLSGCAMPIVFLTASTEHALEAYEVDAVQYLVKPLVPERFFRALDASLELVQRKRERQLVIKAAEGVRQIAPDEIVYCESQKNYQVFYLDSGVCRSRMTAGKLWELLGELPQFDQCGRSYILNLNHVVSVEREKVVLDNGSTIYIPRNKAAEFRKHYFAYYFEGQNV